MADGTQQVRFSASRQAKGYDVFRSSQEGRCTGAAGHPRGTTGRDSTIQV
jgi:hypothetical protein